MARTIPRPRRPQPMPSPRPVPQVMAQAMRTVAEMTKPEEAINEAADPVASPLADQIVKLSPAPGLPVGHEMFPAVRINEAGEPEAFQFPIQSILDRVTRRQPRGSGGLQPGVTIGALTAEVNARIAADAAVLVTVAAADAALDARIDALEANPFLIASQAEAEAGTDNAKAMSPLRTSQAIDVQVFATVNTFTAGQTFSATADAFIRPPAQFTKHSSPLSYNSPSQNAPVMVAQWSDSTALGTNGIRDATASLFRVDGDGDVNLDGAAPAGGNSFSIWRGAENFMRKAGDGSAHAITFQTDVYEFGAVGYNEGGGLIGTVRNMASLRAAIHAVEVVAQDGIGTTIRSGTAQAGSATTITLDAGASAVDDAYKNKGIHITGGTGSGQWKMITGSVGATKVATILGTFATPPDGTSTFDIIDARDTQLLGVNSRVSRNFGGTRDAVNFQAVAGGAVASSAILKNYDGHSWNRGFDLQTATFTSTHAMQLAEGHRLAWIDGSAVSEFYANASGNFVLSPGGANPQVLLANAGTQALPSIALSTDLNTGIFWSAADILAFSAGGTTRVSVKTTGVSFAVPIERGGVMVVDTRATGWGVPTGTLSRSGLATYSGQTITDPVTQAQVQAIDDHLKIVSRTLGALVTDLHGGATPLVHGLLGT